MSTPQLLLVLVTAGSTAAAACSRADTERQARQAAADVRTVASRAGDRVTDSWLTTKIQAQYFADDDIKAREIIVSTRDGVVTLKGHVGTPRAREEAFQIAKNTDGVRQVDDRLTIGPPRQGSAGAAPDATAGAVPTSGGVPIESNAPPADEPRLDDPSITSTIQSKYFLDRALKSRRVLVASHGGVVTLQGEVASEAERAQALLLARTTEGVQRVEDHLTVDAALDLPAPAPADSQSASPAPSQATAAEPSEDRTLVSAVRTRLAAEPVASAASVEVTAKDGVLLLQGTVPTQAAKQRALTVARETKGVLQVVDRLVVEPRR